jgi:hypothetical protein
MGGSFDLWVLLLVDVYFVGVRGDLVQAAQLERARWSALWKLAALSGAATVALALATPARADDQDPSPPLMVAKTAVIALDEPDATASADLATPETESVPAPEPDPVPVRVVATPGWELAAKAPVVRRAVPVRAHVATPAPAISTHMRPVRPARAHHAAKRAHSAPVAAQQQWYQLPRTQYRPASAARQSGHASLAGWTAPQSTVAFADTRPGQLQRARTICELRLRKCLQFCSRIAVDNAPENERWIGTCISSRDRAPGVDREHELLLQRLWSLALDDRATVSGRQYQLLGTQYQSPLATFGWEVVGSKTPRPAPAPQEPLRNAVVMHVTPRRHARVLAAVATHRRHTVRAVRRPSRETRGVEPATQTRPSGSTDWLLRSLIALIGIAILSFMVAAGAVFPAAETALSGMRARLSSRGLSGSRIDLGGESTATPPRARGISYRD